MADGRLSGVFAPVVTPFDNDMVREDWLAGNLDILGESPLKGYLALGSNGESMSLTDQEQLRIVEIFVRHKGGKVLMVGTARESTYATIEFSKKVADIGADFISVLTPHYFAKHTSDEVLLRHYTAIADSIRLPLLLYNAPGFAAGVKISAKTVAMLARHPNIVGMKDSSSDGMNGYLAATRAADSFSILAGSADFFLPSLLMGATGGVLSLANAAPRKCCEVYDAFLRGDLDTARERHHTLFELNRAVSGSGGVASVKAAMDLLGMHGGAPRRPFVALDEKARDTMRRAFQEAGLP